MLSSSRHSPVSRLQSGLKCKRLFVFDIPIIDVSDKGLITVFLVTHTIVDWFSSVYVSSTNT